MPSSIWASGRIKERLLINSYASSSSQLAATSRSASDGRVLPSRHMPFIFILLVRPSTFSIEIHLNLAPSCRASGQYEKQKKTKETPDDWTVAHQSNGPPAAIFSKYPTHRKMRTKWNMWPTINFNWITSWCEGFSHWKLVSWLASARHHFTFHQLVTLGRPFPFGLFSRYQWKAATGSNICYLAD